MPPNGIIRCNLLRFVESDENSWRGDSPVSQGDLAC